MMSLKEFLCEVDSGPGLMLRGCGFVFKAPDEYIRTVTSGYDRVAFDASSDGRFAVMMSYYPGYFRELASYVGEVQGFPCGPYLTPAGVFERPKYWTFSTQTRLRASLDQVDCALRAVGLPWLDILKSPPDYAQAVNQQSPLVWARAQEAVGDLSAARSGYFEMYRRLTGIIDDEGTEENVLREFGGMFVYVAGKLNLDEERVRRFSQSIGLAAPSSIVG